MRMSIFCLLMLFVANVNLTGQHAHHHVCGTSETDQHIISKGLEENQKYVDKYGANFKSLMPSFVPIKFHLIGEADGAGRLDFSSLINQLSLINTQFEDFKFYLKDGTVNEINHTATFNSPTTTAGVSTMINNKDNKAINVFIPQNANTGSGNGGTVLGFYNPPTDYIVVRKSQVGPVNNTLAHEIGHYFDLMHTFFGWESDPWTEERHGLIVSRQFIGQNVRVELVDRSNCTVAADRICDTPVDYNFGITWNGTPCTFPVVVRDANADTIVTMPNNMMGYFQDCEDFLFTPDQNDLMRADFMSSGRSGIRSSYVPDTNLIVGEVVLDSPSFNETVEFYNNVNLEWSALENAQTYYVKLSASGNSDTRVFHTTETSMFFDDLLPGKLYNWTVHPYTESGGGAISKSSIYRTSILMTSTIDPDFVEGVNVFPNPVNQSDKVTLEFNSNINIEATAKLLNIEGKDILNSSFEIIQGRNQRVFDTSALNAGVYFLSITSKEGVLTRKILVNN